MWIWLFWWWCACRPSVLWGGSYQEFSNHSWNRLNLITISCNLFRKLEIIRGETTWCVSFYYILKTLQADKVGIYIQQTCMAHRVQLTSSNPKSNQKTCLWERISVSFAAMIIKKGYMLNLFSRTSGSKPYTWSTKNSLLMNA